MVHNTIKISIQKITLVTYHKNWCWYYKT